MKLSYELIATKQSDSNDWKLRCDKKLIIKWLRALKSARKWSNFLKIDWYWDLGFDFKKWSTLNFRKYSRPKIKQSWPKINNQWWKLKNVGLNLE